jgi:hypothetical protein
MQSIFLVVLLFVGAATTADIQVYFSPNGGCHVIEPSGLHSLPPCEPSKLGSSVVFEPLITSPRLECGADIGEEGPACFCCHERFGFL